MTRLLAAAAVLLTAACGGDRPPAPNVVLVFVDDMGWGDVGVQGAEGWETPHLDRLAAEGVRLSDFYAAQPVCSASRAALLTGCYPNRIGITGALGPQAKVGLHPEETTLGELFQGRGYRTAIFGKWHLGHHPKHLPTRHGFDVYAGIPYSNDMWPFHPENPAAWPPLPLFEQEEIVASNPDQTRFTQGFTERAVAFIEEAAAADEPFFVYLAHPMPHVPLFVDPASEGRSAQGLYGDVLEEIDDSVGALLDVLARTGHDEDTLLIFTSDNGPWLSYGNHAGSAGPLREGKGTTWEGGVRVPFLARWPGVLPAGHVSAEPAMALDVYPTLARLLDVDLRLQRPVDGLDIWPLLTEPGAASPHEVLWFYYHRNDLEAIRAGKWKLHLEHRYRTMANSTPGADGIPGLYDYGVSTPVALYDLETDIGETTDVSAEHPDVLERLMGLVEEARADLGDTLTLRDATGARRPGRHRDG